MSLDITLICSIPVKRMSTGVFVRREGKTVELTKAEAEEAFPGTSVEEHEIETNEVWSGNITHNLAEMAVEVGQQFYEALWRPEDLDTKTPLPLLPILRAGIQKLEANPKHFKAFNPDNGWGTYEQLLQFAKDYEDACRLHPTATIEVSR